MRPERLGIVSYTNVAPLHWSLEPWNESGCEVEFVYGVPSELNAALADGRIDLTLISSIEFIRRRKELRALPDFSIATLGSVRSVMLFHELPYAELGGASIAVSTDSATSVELLRVLLEGAGMRARLVPMAPDLDAMLAVCDAALLIGDAALREAVLRRPVNGSVPLVTDLGEEWYRLTRLPFTFAVWASRADHRPSQRLVAEFRSARELGLGRLAEVAAEEARKLGLEPGVVQRYLANFRYYLEAPDRDGLAAFAALSAPGTSPEELRYWDV
ncbi:MAG: menaquinone biosynthesis protein [Truepera sp.]|nr:menaquinone biosynthesis protein [Truepera sp.]